MIDAVHLLTATALTTTAPDNHFVPRTGLVPQSAPIQGSDPRSLFHDTLLSQVGGPSE